MKRSMTLRERFTETATMALGPAACTPLALSDLVDKMFAVAGTHPHKQLDEITEGETDET
jgi:hypothetical protein